MELISVVLFFFASMLFIVGGAIALTIKDKDDWIRRKLEEDL